MGNTREEKDLQKQTYKETPIRLTADFSAETLQARREWHDILKAMAVLQKIYIKKLVFSMEFFVAQLNLKKSIPLQLVFPGKMFSNV